MLKNIKQLLNEIHFTDKFSKHFVEFWNKYKDSVNDKSLFVTFTMYKNNNLDKNIYLSPETHEDPAGIYAYPLEYVINHPMDLKFAENRTYLQVLRLTSDKVADLQNMDTFELQRAYDVIYGHDQYITNMTLHNFRTPRDKGLLLFRYLIQFKKSGGGTADRSYTNLRTPEEQNNIARKMGYDAIYDDAPSAPEAIINPNEPQQIIFLTRKAFEIVDVFQNNISNRWDVFVKVADKIIGLTSQKSKLPIKNKKYYDSYLKQLPPSVKDEPEGRNDIETIEVELGLNKIYIENKHYVGSSPTKYRMNTTSDSLKIEVTVNNERVPIDTSNTTDEIANEIMHYLYIP